MISGTDLIIEIYIYPKYCIILRNSKKSFMFLYSIYTYSDVVLDMSVYANHNSTLLSTQRWMPIHG